MNTRDPATWIDLSAHPMFAGGRFDPEWYDGDVDSDLAMLREVATAILTNLPNAVCQLSVLDDCTMYVAADFDERRHVEIFPALTEDNRPCYYVDIESHNEELRLPSVNEVISSLVQLFVGGR